jgi:hypothetical protein
MTINRMEYIVYWLWHYATWPPYPLGRRLTNRRTAIAWLLYHHRYRNGGFITQWESAEA